MSYENRNNKGIDLIFMASICSFVGNELFGKEGNDAIETYVKKFQEYNYAKRAIKNIYYHYASGNEILKTAILSIPYIMKDGIIISPWKKGHNKKQMTSAKAAPFVINSIRYIGVLI